MNSSTDRVYETPTFDQLVSFVAVHLYGAAGMFPAQIERTRLLLEADDDWRKQWYRRHYETQRDIWQRADEEREKAAR